VAGEPKRGVLGGFQGSFQHGWWDVVSTVSIWRLSCLDRRVTFGVRKGTVKPRLPSPAGVDRC
jgi:hypothetical protein